MKRILIAAVLPLLAAAAPAGQGNAIVSGRVTDASGAPIDVALVRIEALSVGAVTRANGEYRLVLPPERIGRDARGVVVRASHRGFAPASRSITVTPGEIASADFRLQPAAAK
jgi:carboxypeptidase family protein